MIHKWRGSFPHVPLLLLLFLPYYLGRSPFFPMFDIITILVSESIIITFEGVVAFFEEYHSFRKGSG
jgi:hypothetical protein